MAKLVHKVEKRPSVKIAPDVRRVRAKFAEALRVGYSHKEAAALAKSDEPINGASKPMRQRPLERVRLDPPRQIASGAVPMWEESREPRSSSVSTTKIHGQSDADQDDVSDEVRDSIPPNWKDLPWTNLKNLAESILGSEIKSRKHAAHVIEKELRGSR